MPEARSLALGDKGTVFVSNRNLTNVYAIVDRGGKREVKKLLKGLNAPNGVAFSKGTLYVAERHRITRYDGIEDKLDNPPRAKVVIDNLDPTSRPGHFWKFLAMGPDGKLYFNIGAPRQHRDAELHAGGDHPRRSEDRRAWRTLRTACATRSAWTWHPQTKQLWFTNHGRDWLGDDMPNDTLHRVSTQEPCTSAIPFCHQGDFLDPEFGKGRSCDEFATPGAKLGAHIAPLGMKFYTGKMFPAEYQNNMFIAHARLVEPHRQAGLRRDARGRGCERQGED